MKKVMSIAAFCVLASFGLFGQTGKAGSGATRRVLFIYEESNENLDPWEEYFWGELATAGFEAEKAAASELGSKDLSAYDFIVIHGAVMAFTSKEPIRDWLKKNPDLDGAKVSLLVTANRWFLDKYNKQLLGLLKERNADVIDAVSSATKKLGKEEKQKLVRDQIERLKTR